MSLDYKKSGVNIEEANKSVNKIKSLVRKTFNNCVLTDIGSFGAFYQPDFSKMEQPILVSSVDGVGTKIKIAIEMGIYDTVGQCLVNHCVDDILTQGAVPMYFMDYIGTGKVLAENIEQIVAGLAKACSENGAALIGGELAEMPGVYHDDDFDLVGSITGMVDKRHIVDGQSIKPGDIIIGLPSSGLHTNGYSFVRKLVETSDELDYSKEYEMLGETLASALLKVHISYLPVIKPLLGHDLLKGMAHITGGGMEGNLNRILPKTVDAVIDTASWDKLPIFEFLHKYCDTQLREFYKMFNMGIGFVLIASKEKQDELQKRLSEAGQKYFVIGEVTDGKGDVVLKNV